MGPRSNDWCLYKARERERERERFEVQTQGRRPYEGRQRLE